MYMYVSYYVWIIRTLFKFTYYYYYPCVAAGVGNEDEYLIT